MNFWRTGTKQTIRHSLRRRQGKDRHKSSWCRFLGFLLGLLFLLAVLLIHGTESEFDHSHLVGASNIAQTRSNPPTWVLDLIEASLAVTLTQPTTKCHCDGNCPNGFACTTNGVCQSFELSLESLLRVKSLQESSTSKQRRRTHEQCVSMCQRELFVEEGFQYGSIPRIELTTDSSSSTMGCVLYFRREKRTTPWATEDRPSLQDRLYQRLRAVIRTDPVLGKASTDFTYPSGNKTALEQPPILLWKAYCRPPCKSNRDCDAGWECVGRQSDATQPMEFLMSNRSFIQKTCQPQQQREFSEDMVLVSGADETYFAGLENLAASLHYWSPKRKLVVYNLGMDEEQLVAMESWPNLLEVRWRTTGIPASYPEHVRQNLKNYAWKSLIINETVHEFKSIFWLDAGATLVSSMDPIEEIVHRHGIFLVKGQDENMKYQSHRKYFLLRGLSKVQETLSATYSQVSLPSEIVHISFPAATYQWFGYDKKTYRTGPHWAGGIQGHIYPSRYIDTVVVPNAQCALDYNCISPTGSSLANHRYDQTSLSILGYQTRAGPAGGGPLPAYTEFLAADESQLQEDLGQDSYPFVLWTARGLCQYYAYHEGWHQSN